MQKQKSLTEVLKFLQNKEYPDTQEATFVGRFFEIETAFVSVKLANLLVSFTEIK